MINFFLKNSVLITSFIFIFFSCSEKKSVLENNNLINETEPNDLMYQANEIDEEHIFKGFVDKPLKNKHDSDLFKIWKPSGTIITFEIETDESEFMPYIGHTDNLSHAQFVIFNPEGKNKAEFITSVDGWQYFEIGDRRNTSEDGEKTGGYTYYFRVMSSHICNNYEYDEISDNNEISERIFRNNVSEPDIVKMKLSQNGIYQLKVETSEMISDKFTFVFNCDSGKVIAGNDDEDYYSNLMDPLIYSQFENNLNNLIVTGRLLTDLRSSGLESFSISLKRQLPDFELEPNNFFNYANFLMSDSLKGELNGDGKVEDYDWFKLNLLKGEIINFSVKPANNNVFTAEIWAGSYLETGANIIPLRFSSLSSTETHRINMMMPFSGTIYFLLSGSNVPYNFEIFKESEIDHIIYFNGRATAEFDSSDCGWHFFKWTMPVENDFFEITLSSEIKAGMHIFSSDFKPLAFLEPDSINRFFIHRYELSETLFFGLYFQTCEQQSTETMKFKINNVLQNFYDWNENNVEHLVKFSGNGSYQGYFDTDSYLVENFFEIEVEKSGVLYLLTAPFLQTTDFDIDTVITLYKGTKLVAQNDDVIEFINYNKYSFMKAPVKKGEKYTVKVSPFMTESSHIPSMNITGNYILDIIIK